MSPPPTLPNISFTNNIGTITFHRTLMSIGDTWSWDGSSTRHLKTIRLNGFVMRAPDAQLSEGMEDILRDIQQMDPITGAGTGVYNPAVGHLGSLLLPWTTLSNVRIENISYDNSNWLDGVRVSATFVDENPDNNLYTVSFFGLTLHNPRLSLPIPFRNLHDDYTQMQPQNNASGVSYIDNTDYSMSPVRTRQTADILEVTIAGTVWIDEIPGLVGFTQIAASGATLYQKIRYLKDTLSQRSGTSDNTVTDGPLPGWPTVHSMVDVSSQLAATASGINFWGMIIGQSRATWDVERDNMQIEVVFLTQPEAWYE